ncbi:hypothetical protein ACJX0J_007746, partial [Zea mays]
PRGASISTLWGTNAAPAAGNSPMDEVDVQEFVLMLWYVCSLLKAQKNHFLNLHHLCLFTNLNLFGYKLDAICTENEVVRIWLGTDMDRFLCLVLMFSLICITFI